MYLATKIRLFSINNNSGMRFFNYFSFFCGEKVITIRIRDFVGSIYFRTFAAVSWIIS